MDDGQWTTDILQTMHNKQTGRVIFILLVLLGAVVGIFQYQVVNLFKPVPWTQKMMLQPGLDIAGGTSLLYQIKMPEGGYHPSDGHTLAEDEMAALKRRIDPGGLKNYIWRPQGTDRLEIQIPASAQNEQAIKARDAYVAAQQALDKLSIRPKEVTFAIENLKGPEQAARLNELADGMDSRKTLFAKLVAAHEAMLAAHTAKNADAEALASNEYDKLVTQIESTNVKPSKLESILEEPASQRKTELDALKASAGGSPDRVKAIDQFAAAFDGYHGLKVSIDDAAQLKRDLQGSGVLEFHIAVFIRPPQGGIEFGPGITKDVYDKMVHQLETKGPRPQAGDQFAWYQVDRTEDFKWPTASFDGKEYFLCWTTPDKSMVNGPRMKRWAMREVTERQNQEGQKMVAFELDTVGGSLFYDLTKANINRPLSAILDRKVISVANIESAIGTDGTITGDYTDDELRYLVTTLNAGSLPAQLEDEPISEHVVEPALGQANLNRGLLACAFGLVIVAVFLISYYYLAGVVATFAVLMNVVLILGVLSAFGATFTLPGVAGIVLTIGAAVDANVLIFERLREEQHLGFSLRVAMKNAYDHAQSAIWDSNATTIITSIILYFLGSEEVKGFGITLLIGLCSSLFTSLFVTRTIFNILIDDFHIKNLSSFPRTFPKWDKLLKPDINWMRMAPIFWVFSTVFIIAGMTAFIVKSHEHDIADVDFSSGTQVQFDLKAPMTQEQVLDAINSAKNPALPAPNVTGVGDEQGAKNMSYEMVTANADAKSVKTALLDVLGSKIKTDLPSKFDHVNDPIETAMSSDTVMPVTPATSTIKDVDMKIPADEYFGGVAVVLKDITPPLKPDQIRERLDRERAGLPAATAEAAATALANYTVLSPLGANVPTSTAVVLTNDPSYPYDKDQAKWISNVADPIWQLVKNGVDSGGQLQKVNTFGPQVAGDNQQSAFFALVLSSLVIMAYIWFRFGNLKYGTATVLAMIHDVALVVGAVGLSHYIVKIPWLANALMIEPFRVNLTIVAAVLTVMSYSMIDTIVVFDRIRENRGKFGYLSRKIVNDSINQTLSRTLLTAGTTIVTVAGMYVVGGPGIHGFTFVLLVGILVGTYSSIAIAAPFLLIGEQQSKEAGRKLPPTGTLQRVAG
jgi:SecD/SecF fusion protein